MNIRVQANKPTTAVEALQEACETLDGQCDWVLQKLEELVPEVKKDRLQVEAKLREMEQDELAGQDQGDMDEDDMEE